MDSKNKMHMISWDKICRPKLYGGLGIPSLAALQYAFNCSVISRMYNCESPLSAWLLQRYISPWRPPPVYSSKFWKLICCTASEAKHFFSFNISAIAPVSLYWDHWCINDAFAGNGYGYQFFTGTSANTRLMDFIIDNTWNLPHSLPDSVKQQISDLHIHESATCLVWKNSGAGIFRDYVNGFYSNMDICPWANLIWHKGAALRFSVYVWMSIMGALKTADALSKRNILVHPVCSLCNLQLESSMHLFFECPFSHSTLIHNIPVAKNLLIRPTVLHLFEWIDSCYASRLSEKNFFLLMASCTIYFVWKERNDRRFGSSFKCSKTVALNVRSSVYEKITNWKDAGKLKELL
ncbi:uncharacterized protein LOC110115034 [Dendrobium catenatum]|uniref:uncharacterized protein LOC110115034 n=1 Tax=Dendrobium catenatum TaxID=906689 RepID=UPI0009F1F01D|nr:uncharacterized protein LOC110115034 [Dendrobium catenatum]